MAASNSSDRSRKSRGSGKGGRASSAARSASQRKGTRSPSSSRGSRQRTGARAAEPAHTRQANGLTGLAEQLVTRILKPLGLVVLSRERIADVVDDAAARGRLTRSDAEQLISELVQRGRQQTDEVLADLDRTLGRGREQLDIASRRARRATPDRLMRGADRARRTIGVGPSFPILGYDELTVSQVQTRLPHLSDAELRTVRDYERRHANRKSVLGAIEKALG
jgi:polyhydroxyalkanoate synthesis regulator phasin